MLKQVMDNDYAGGEVPAAFRRLCVETENFDKFNGIPLPAAFRRLCVETGYG